MKPASVYTVEQTPDGYIVCRDGVVVSTPAGFALTLPSKVLAESIAAEAPQPKSKPADIPLFQQAIFAIDIAAPKPNETVDKLMTYANSELLCHRAETPPALVEAQNKVWQPLLDWCAKHFHAPLNTSTGIMPIKQPDGSLQNLRKAIAAYDTFRLTGLRQAVMASGSLVLGLALCERHLNAEETCRVAELDAEYQMKGWGEDPDTQARIASLGKELELLENWFNLLVTI